MPLVQVQYIGTSTKYGLEMLHLRGKKVEAKGQEVFGAVSLVCRFYIRKLDLGRAKFSAKTINFQKYLV